MKSRCILLILSFSLFSFSCGVRKADIILRNGDVYTVEAQRPWAKGLAVKGNKIIAVFDDDRDADAFIRPSTRVIDLSGKLAVPGFIDAHVHFASFAAQQHDIMLMNVESDAGLIGELKRVVPLVGKGEWITGGDWSGAILWNRAKGETGIDRSEDRWRPDRFSIDKITENNPCFLNSYDGEFFLANTAALQAAGLENSVLEGMDVRGGRATGLIRRGSEAIEKIRAVIQPKSEARIQNEYRTGLERLAEMGIVEMHDMIHSFEEIERYVALQQKGELTCRVWVRPWLDLADGVYERGYRMGHHPVTRKRDHYLRFGGMKSANDGFLGNRGAMLFEPYTDRPDYRGHYQEYNSDSDTYGSLVGNPEVYYNYCKAAVEHGYCVDSHAIGDRGVSEVIDVLERIHEDLDVDMSMFRIIHAEIVQPREFDRMKTLNLIAETNPSQLPDDKRWLIDRLGPEREKLAFPFRTFLDKGVVMNFGSDVPGNAGAIFLNHPKYVLNAAVNRTDNEGKPKGGWHPQHKISMKEALKCFTLNGAYACMREDRVRGSIKPGKLADITVVDRNIFENAPEDVLNMDVLMTIVDGRIVFEKMK